MKPGLKVRVTSDKTKNLADDLHKLTREKVLVGIPTTTAADRQAGIMKLLGASTSGPKGRKLAKAAKAMVNNAQLLFIHTYGSPIKHIPARPVLEPAIMDRANLEIITAQLRLAADAALAGRPFEVYLERAGQAAENAARSWFTNPRNGWAPNKPATIRAKGSSRPLIDTGELRKSVTHVVTKESGI